jgi:D-glycero-alpha-D-manno-heptose-7-phosphate kinase
LGGKLLGAGGGGYFLFYVPPINRHKFLNFVENCRNISLQKFKFEDEGLQSWTTRTSYK